ncbi:MAG: hypothetical protein RJA25_2014 [Bacteroidota bacterium]|jgi:LysM repeat protein
MKTNKYLLIAILFLNIFSAKAQQKKDSTAVFSYIQQYKNIAQEEMKRVGIPASITIAQGIHESSFGTSYLAKNTNNHFGIKCKENWTGKTFKYTDDAPNECFRVYDKVEDSYHDHSDFLKYRPYYQSLFKLDLYDYKAWAYGLKKAGYATNPKYAEILIKLIEDYQLFLLDKNLALPYLSTTEKPALAVEDTTDEEDDLHTEASKKTNQENKIEIQQPTVTPVVTTQKINKNIFKINNTKAVKIYINKGETLDLLSQVLNVSKEDLLNYNDITDESIIKDGQTIFIQHKKKSNKEENYNVRQEDNMWSISQKTGVRFPALLKMNKLENGEEPAAKETIVLKGKIKEKPALRKATSSTKKESIIKANNDIFRARDTVYAVAKDTVKLSVDSNTVLGWEKDTKLLEKPKIAPYSPMVVKKDSAIVTIKKEEIKIDTQQPATNPPTPGSTPKPADTTWSPNQKTVYPANIDYSKLPKSNTNTHTVVKGDTMYNVCKRYNISVAQLMQWNNLSEQSIKLGQVLKIQP